MENQSKYHVIVSEQATQMLVSHAAFLAQVSPEAAERLTVEFEKTANSLEIMPQRCPWLSGEYIPKNAYRFILFEKTLYDYLSNHRRYRLCGLCGGLQAGLRMAHPLTTEYQKKNRHLTAGGVFFLPKRRCFSFGSQDQ